MLKRYLLLALRQLRKNRIILFTNAFGLGLSMTCCLAAYLWLAYDLEFDAMHDNHQTTNIFKVHGHWDDPQPGQNILTPYSLAARAFEEIPGIEKFMRYFFETGYVRFDRHPSKEGIAFADASFFELFDFPRTSGNLQSFKEIQNVIITDELASKLFGVKNPIGKSITVILNNGRSVDLNVGAVIEKMPANSSFTFDVIIRLEHHRTLAELPSTDWSIWPSYSTYFQLNNPDNVSSIEKQLQLYITEQDLYFSKFELEHFKADFSMEEILGATVNVRMWQTPINFLVGFTLILFLVACFNLANTTYCIMGRRVKEIGIRKVLGAGYWDIARQTLVEISLTIFMSILFASCASLILVPEFASMWSQSIGNRWDDFVFQLQDVNIVRLFVIIAIVIVLSGLVSGLFPILRNLKVKPIKMLTFNSSAYTTGLINYIFILFQLAMSVLVLFAGITFSENTRMMSSSDHGFDYKGLTFLSVEADEVGALERRVSQLPSVDQFGLSKDHIGQSLNLKEVESGSTEVTSKVFAITRSYQQIAGLRLLDGRFLVESDKGRSILVTQSFARKARLTNPVGSVVKINGSSYSIVGVVQDVIDNWYVVEFLNEAPCVFVISDFDSGYLVIRSSRPNSNEEILGLLREEWFQLYPERPFEGGDQMETLEKGQLMQSGNLKKAFLFLTVVIVTLTLNGIYSVVSLNTEGRAHEIGIRKVLGASISRLVGNLSWRLTLLTATACLFGSSIGYYLIRMISMNQYRILFKEVGPGGYVIASASLCLFTMVVSGFVIYRTANRNPVEILRTE